MFNNFQISLKNIHKPFMKEYIRTSGFLRIWEQAIKLPLCVPPPPSDYPAHAFRCPKEPLQPDLKVKRSFDM